MIPTGGSAAITHQVTVKSTKAVFADESLPDANMNTFDANFLRVGRTTEFAYRQRTFVQWSPISQTAGGPLPTDADITAVKVRLYKHNATGGSVTIYRPAASWTEGGLTWNNQPPLISKGGVPLSVTTLTLPATTGWVDITIPISIVQAWLDSPTQNYGLAIHANWTTITSVSLRSDEYANYQPQLVITYLGSSPPAPPPPTPSDTVPCELTYTVSPPNPRAGEPVTVTVRGTDNQAMSYVAILRGALELARRDAVGTSETTLEVSYTETATLPSLSYTLLADDLGESLPRRVDITVPVTGSGSSPVVSVSADWDVREVVPARFRLIEGDGQLVTVTASASDPDGIQSLTIYINGTPHDFSYPTVRTSVSESVAWTNTDRSRTHFTFSASARDREGLTTTAPGETHSITRFSDITLLWNRALPFGNYTKDRLSWERMVHTFGPESWWIEAWNWPCPYAYIWYHAGFKNIAAGGHCWGLSLTVAEMYKGRLSAGNLEAGAGITDLDKAHQYTLEYVEARHGGQLGDKNVISAIDQYVTWVAEISPHLRLLGYIQDDLRRDTPGLIAIRESGQGHIILPWMTRRMSDGTTRVYVYDCNYHGVHDPPKTFTNSLRNAGADFTYFPHYPYLEMSQFEWHYALTWNVATNSPRDIWNDRLLYFDYEDALGRTWVRNAVGPVPPAPSVSDQNLTGLIDAIIGIFGGTGEVYFQDQAGRVTGVQNGVLKEQIPGSHVIVPFGAGSETQIYVVPNGAKYSINVRGTAAGEYTLGLIGESTAYSIEDKNLTTGGVDRYLIEPKGSSQDLSVRLLPGVADGDFTVRLAKRLPGRVAVLNHDFVGREYVLRNVSAAAGDDFAVHTAALGDSLIVAGNAGQVRFDALLRSTASAAAAGTGPLPYIPGSVADGLVAKAGETIRLTPLNWATTEASGEVEVGSGETTVIKLYIGSQNYYVGSTRLTMDTAPIIRESRTLLPIRFVAEPLGADLDWDGVAQKVTITMGTKVIELWVGHNQARVNGVLTYIDPDNLNVVPIIVPPGRTMMPVRFVTEALGCGVGWRQETQEVTIIYPAP